MLYLVELIGQRDADYQSVVVEGPDFDRQGAAEPHPEVWDFALDMASEKAVERQADVILRVSAIVPARVNLDGTRVSARQFELRSTLIGY